MSSDGMLQLTSEELVSAVIARIREVEVYLNAVVDDRFEAALEDARIADDEIAACNNIPKLAEAKPFLGVPFTVKDCISIKGSSSNGNSKELINLRLYF